MPLWDSPIHVIRCRDRRVKVDVTLSAQPIRADKPIGFLNALVADLRMHGARRILDFGAGKLRNTVPLLRRGFEVYACEYREQFANYESSRKILEAVEREHNFRTLVYPRQFYESNIVFDTVLMIHVLHIIPSVRHRLQILRACAGKLRPQGLLLWTTPFHETSMRRRCTNDNACRDGWVLNRSDERQTFYGEFPLRRILEWVEPMGFQRLRSYGIEKAYAILFQKQA